MTIAEFEAVALSQRPASEPWTPVTDYSFEARKAIEGQHPQLILDVFKPKRILDVGCGFGYLVRLINEVAGETIAYGADVNNRQAFLELDITASNIKSASKISAELVIAREVLEHLTLLQIRKAVTNLCALSSRFVYATTRYSSEHDIFRVETSDDLDPTHITIASKDLYRLLLTLEGFKARYDLEAKMDWQGKGRCLVYERAT